MRWPPECGNAGSNTGVRIGSGGTNQTDRRGRSILLVIGMQDEQQVERPGRDGIDLVGFGRYREHHVQKAIAVRQRILRVCTRPAHRMTIGCGRDGRHLRNQTFGGQLALFRFIDIELVVVERRHRADHTRQNRHGMGVVVKSLHERIELFMHHRVVGDIAVEPGELGLAWQFTVEQQVGHLKERGMLGQLLDRIATISQDALVTVDEGDVALAARRAAITRIKGEIPQRLVQPRDVQGRITFGAGNDGKIQRLAGLRISEIHGSISQDDAPSMIAGSAPVRLGSSDQGIEHPRKPIMVAHCIHTVAYLPGEDVLGDRQRLLAVALLETVDAPARIHDLVLTGVERMRLA